MRPVSAENAIDTSSQGEGVPGHDPRPVLDPVITRTGRWPPWAPPAKTSIALPRGRATATRTSFLASTAATLAQGLKLSSIGIVRATATPYKSPGRPLAPGRTTLTASNVSPPTTYSKPFASTAMAWLSGPWARKMRDGSVLPCAPGGNTNVVASLRKVCTYRCPVVSKATPQGSQNVFGLFGLATVRTEATAPWLPAAYAVTGPESALAT